MPGSQVRLVISAFQWVESWNCYIKSSQVVLKCSRAAPAECGQRERQHSVSTLSKVVVFFFF